MLYRTIPGTSIEVSALAVGCNTFGQLTDQAEATAIALHALDSGVNHFDTASSYSGGRSEELLGRALGSRRGEAIVATKFGSPKAPEGRGASPAVIRESVEASLRRLGTDYIDLYYLHYPDPQTPPEVTLEVLEGLVSAGTVRAIACSNVTGAQLTHFHDVAQSHGYSAFRAVQGPWNLLQREIEQDLVPVADQLGTGVIPYFPLASGLLTGKYRRGDEPPPGTRAADWPQFGGGGIASDERLKRVEVLRRVAEELGRPLLDLAIGWLVAQPQVVSVLAGARRQVQLQQNILAMQRPLAPSEVEALNAVTDEISTGTA